MIPVGYMYKQVVSAPRWLRNGEADIYSVSNCLSRDFCEWIRFWKHNGFWFFDSLEVIEDLARGHAIDLSGMKPFYYRAHPNQWVSETLGWERFRPDSSFSTNVSEPATLHLEGFDVVTYSTQSSAECSPLSCNHLGGELPVNRHCLFETFLEARNALEANILDGTEPGPYRIIEVNSV